MKEKEKEIAEYLKSKGIELILNSDQYCSYDAMNKRSIVEFKYREKYYEDKMSEALKIFQNFHYAELRGMKFIYVVKDPKGVWYCNITDNIDNIIILVPEIMDCPRQTEFEDKRIIKKVCYNIPEEFGKYI